jgi:hypothetical protein
MNNQPEVFLHIFDWSFGFAAPWTFGPFAPKPSIGSRFFCLCSSSVSPATPFAGNILWDPAHLHRSVLQTHCTLRRSVPGLAAARESGFFQSVASIFPVAKKRWICRAVYFIREYIHGQDLGDSEGAEDSSLPSFCIGSVNRRCESQCMENNGYA